MNLQKNAHSTEIFHSLLRDLVSSRHDQHQTGSLITGLAFASEV